MTLPRIPHRIEAISFRLGVVECSCGAVATNEQEVRNGQWRYRAGTPEALAGAFAAHRTSVGLSSSDGTGHLERAETFRTALGTSKLSGERGRMGVAAKRAKAQ